MLRSLTKQEMLVENVNVWQRAMFSSHGADITGEIIMWIGLCARRRAMFTSLHGQYKQNDIQTGEKPGEICSQKKTIQPITPDTRASVQISPQCKSATLVPISHQNRHRSNSGTKAEICSQRTRNTPHRAVRWNTWRLPGPENRRGRDGPRQNPPDRRAHVLAQAAKLALTWVRRRRPSLGWRE